MERRKGETGDSDTKEFEENGEVAKETLERVAAAKKYIESHYKSHMKHIQDRRQRYNNVIIRTYVSLIFFYACTPLPIKHLQVVMFVYQEVMLLRVNNNQQFCDFCLF